MRKYPLGRIMKHRVNYPERFRRKHVQKLTTVKITVAISSALLYIFTFRIMNFLLHLYKMCTIIMKLPDKINDFLHKKMHHSGNSDNVQP